MNKSSAILLLAVLLPACRNAQRTPIVRNATAMNTYVSITVYDDDKPQDQINRALDSAIASIKKIDSLASDYNDSSEIGRANLASGVDSLEVSEPVADLLRISLAYCEATHGVFDITVGPLKKLWDFLAAHPRVPPLDSIRAALKLVNYRLVALHDHTLYLPLRGMALDIGAIGKGYAIDRASGVLARAGIKRSIVDIGGKLLVRWEGTHGFDSTVATISVRHPRKEGAFLGTFKYGAGGVSTSGDYERFFFSDGNRYHHLLNLATGYPMRGIVSVTVVAGTATIADAVSTVAFLLGRQEGMAYIRSIPGVEGFVVYEQADSLAIEMSPGFQGRLSMTHLHD